MRDLAGITLTINHSSFGHILNSWMKNALMLIHSNVDKFCMSWWPNVNIKNLNLKAKWELFFSHVCKLVLSAFLPQFAVIAIGVLLSTRLPWRKLKIKTNFERSVFKSILALAVMFECISVKAKAVVSSTATAYTGNIQNYTVPNNCHVLSVKLWGAGGAGGANSYGSGYGFAGGSGGYTSCNISVTPGQVLFVLVGGGGGKGTVWTSDSIGGYGGGGSGYASSIGIGNYHGGGGGRSAIQFVQGEDVVTAGGGGGGEWFVADVTLLVRKWEASAVEGRQDAYLLSVII